MKNRKPTDEEAEIGLRLLWDVQEMARGRMGDRSWDSSIRIYRVLIEGLETTVRNYQVLADCERERSGK